MVLQAAYCDELLRPFIDYHELRELVLGTLRFLRDVADSASSLWTDIRILQFAAVKSKVLKESEVKSPPSTNSANTSFSSNAGVAAMGTYDGTNH
jgi:hypothetical protein